MIVVMTGSGCASLWDAPKNILGYSTREMEEARATSSYLVYQTDLKSAFDAVADIVTDKSLYVHIKDELRGMIVVMNVPGVVDTTEVGIFFTAQENGVKVEVSSRSTPAKKAVALMLFSALPEFLTDM